MKKEQAELCRLPLRKSVVFYIHPKLQLSYFVMWIFLCNFAKAKENALSKETEFVGKDF